MKPVQLYMRVENQEELCVGTAQSMRDIPCLLEEIAAMFRGRLAAQSVSGCACQVSSDEPAA